MKERESIPEIGSIESNDQKLDSSCPYIDGEIQHFKYNPLSQMISNCFLLPICEGIRVGTKTRFNRFNLLQNSFLPEIKGYVRIGTSRFVPAHWIVSNCSLQGRHSKIRSIETNGLKLLFSCPYAIEPLCNYDRSALKNGFSCIKWSKISLLLSIFKNWKLALWNRFILLQIISNCRCNQKGSAGTPKCWCIASKMIPNCISNACMEGGRSAPHDGVHCWKWSETFMSCSY